MKTMSLIYDAIVIGAGIEGSATAYNLAKDNKKVLLLEQFPLPHTRGSSHGQSRIIRKAYLKRHYAAMMSEAYQLWNTLEEEIGSKLLYQTGLLVVCPKTKDYVDNTEKALQAIGSVYQRLTGDQINAQFPMVKFKTTDVGVYDREGGVLFADKCLRGFQNMLVKYGGHLKDGEQVIDIIPGNIVTIQTTKGLYKSKSIIITAGPWTSKLLKPLGLVLPLKPQKINVCYWRQLGQHYGIEQKFPTLMVVEENHYYALPVLEYPGHVKICLHEGPDIDPDKRDDCQEANSKALNNLNGFVEEHFNYTEKTPSIREDCIYTWTPDEDFILDKHPLHENIVIGAGFSGHGFKMAPVIGKILSQLAFKKQPHIDMTPFKIDRFGLSKAKL